MVDITEYENQLQKKMLEQDRAIENLFNLFAVSVSYKFARLLDGGSSKRKMIIEQSNIDVERLHAAIEKQIISSIEWSFRLSNFKNDNLVKTFTAKLTLRPGIQDKLYNHNQDALKNFIARTNNGLNLSERIWKLTDQAKEQIEMDLEIGISKGKSAYDIARDLKILLKEPDNLFRRVRNSEGELIPSNPMKNYETGRGIYKSSHKNAFRLAVTEINMAYRTADYERWGQLDFVTGIEVRLSSAHPRTDICDHMKGKYPKEFKFTGWHPFCICHAVPILLPKEKFVEYMNMDREKASVFLEKNKVKFIPDSSLDYVKKNKPVFENWKNKPIWYNDNFNTNKYDYL